MLLQIRFIKINNKIVVSKITYIFLKLKNKGLMIYSVLVKRFSLGARLVVFMTIELIIKKKISRIYQKLHLFIIILVWENYTSLKYSRIPSHKRSACAKLVSSIGALQICKIDDHRSSRLTDDFLQIIMSKNLLIKNE